MTLRGLGARAKRFSLAYVHEGALGALSLVLLGIALDVLALPPGPVPWAILVADIPFLWLLWRDEGRRWKRWAFLYGFLHFGVGLRWLAEIHPLQVVGAAFVLGPIYVLFGLGIRWGVKRGAPYLLVVPTAAVLEEMLQTVWMGGMPWPARSLSLAGEPALLASTALLGAYGLSYLAALSSAVVSGVPSVLRVHGEQRSAMIQRLVVGALAPAALAAAFVVYGHGRIHGFDVRERNGESLSTPPLIAIQGNVPQSLKHSSDEDAAKTVFHRHLDLSMEAMASVERGGHHPLAVLWPETMVPWPLVDPELGVHDVEGWENQLRIIQNIQGIHPPRGETKWLLGAIHRFLRDPKDPTDVGEHDSLFLVDPALVPVPVPDVPPSPPDPRNPRAPWILARHDKVVLVPGGEYTPLGDVLPPLRAFRDLVSVIPELDAGSPEQTPFLLFQESWQDPGGKPVVREVRGGTAICFEIAFPARCRAWRSAGAQVLLNAANYSWFGETGFRAQILAVARLRAAELGATVVMAGNTGPTAFFDPVGRAYGEFFDAAEGPMGPVGSPETTHRDGWASGVLHADSEETAYARWGDYPWLGLGMALVGVALLRPVARRRPPEGAPRGPEAAGPG